MNENNKINQKNETSEKSGKSGKSENQNGVEETKKKQVRNLAILFSGLLCLLGVLYLVISGNGDTEKNNHEDDAEFASAVKHIEVGSVLVERTEERLNQAEKAAAALQKDMIELNKERERKEQEVYKEQEKINLLVDRIIDLEKVLGQNRLAANQGISGNAVSGNTFPSSPGAQGGVDGYNPQALMTQGIRDDAIGLIPNPYDQDKSFSETSSKNPKDYVPSGTFVKAIALGGADASAAVNAQSNPQPMLFRIVDNGTMPNNKKSHLKGCLATAAVVGDISSERGFIRLETLSCVEPGTDKIIDLNVEGTVFGPEGKSGIRGIPMWREGKLLQRAFAAGALSGLSSAITQKYTQTSISPLGTIKSLSSDTKDILQHGAAGGIGTAMEKLADYNIKRAEQYHPVLQLSAGTVVDIVFLKGFYFDGSKKDASRSDENRNRSRSNRAVSGSYTQNLNTGSGANDLGGN